MVTVSWLGRSLLKPVPFEELEHVLMNYPRWYIQDFITNLIIPNTIVNNLKLEHIEPTKRAREQLATSVNGEIQTWCHILSTFHNYKN